MGRDPGHATIAGTARAPPPPRPERVATPQPRALTEVERKEIKAVLNSDEFVDEAPATVYAKLLDQGIYLGSVSTMYRVLREHDEVGDRRRHATHPAKKKPELIAKATQRGLQLGHHQAARPREVDLLLPLHDHRHLQPLRAGLDAGPGRAGRAWPRHSSSRPSTSRASDRDQLTIHADRGSPMIAKPVAHLLADLGVTKSHSRPHVSNDNPYSESQFRTFKYRPDFPETLRQSFEDAQAHCGRFFDWYNDDHRHSGIGFHTPADVHYGRAELVRRQRGVVLDDAYAEHPERFVRKLPTPPALPAVAWINEPEEDAATTQ